MSHTQLKPVWAEADFRLDPFRLPHAASFRMMDAHGDVTFTVSSRGATIRRVLETSGLPVSIALPARAFRGVAARAIEDGEGSVTVTLELMHADPMLSVPLLVAHDLDNVAADWRAWSEAFKLPMLLVEADGVARSLDENAGQIRKAPPATRRQGRVHLQRRPRFLARRKTGALGVRLIINGEEIIARR